MVNIAKIYSTLGDPNSLIPLAIKDTTSTAGMTVGSYITGKEEGYDRFIDEVGTEVIWLGGIPFFKWLFDKTVFKALKLDSEFDARNLKNKDVLAKIQEFAPTENIKQDIGKISKKSGTFRKAAAAKFFVSTALTVASYIGLTKFKQNYTEKQIRANLIAEHEAEKSKQNVTNKTLNQSQKSKPSFKGLGSAVESLAFSPVKNMWVLDGCITAERLKDSRTEQEFIGYAIKEASILTFMYYAGEQIQKQLEKQAEAKGKSISLDARVLEDGFLKDAFKDGSIQKSLKELEGFFNKKGELVKSEAEIYEFLHKNPDNLVVKTAKMSDVISMYEESQGLFKKAKVTDKIDTRKYIDLRKIGKITQKMELLYEQYKDALSKGDTADDFFNQVKKLKRKSILTNIGSCMLALGVFTPAIMLCRRYFSKDNQEFETKKQIRDQLVKEGLIA